MVENGERLRFDHDKEIAPDGEYAKYLPSGAIIKWSKMTPFHAKD